MFRCETKRDLAVKLVGRHFVFLETDREIPLERAKRGARKDLRTQAMTLTIVRLELARDPAHPEGSSSHGYEFVAPLNDDGRIDAEAWRKVR